MLGLPVLAQAQSGANVLVVCNANSPDSLDVALLYAGARGVPAGQVLKLPLRFESLPPGGGLGSDPAEALAEGEWPDEVSRADYEVQIERPIARWIARHGAYDRILYIVLVRGIPLRVTGSGGRSGTVASVDSELALLYRRLSGAGVELPGPTQNPYFLADRALAEARPFTHESHDIYLVTRLDGFSSADARALIERAQQPADAGVFGLDLKGEPDPANRWLTVAAERLRAEGLTERVLLEDTKAPLRDREDLLGYFSWGSNDRAITARDLGLRFRHGAIAGSFVSTDGRTFREPPPEWAFGTWPRPSTLFAGSPDSLAGDFIRAGVTGVAAHVAEPFLDAVVRPQVLFPAYVRGFTLAEAFYLAMPFLSWQTIVVGDPLCRIARHEGPADAELDPPTNPLTELPRYFAVRRLKALREQHRPARSGAQEDQPGTAAVDAAAALALVARAEARLARDDEIGARQALEEAIDRAPRLAVAHLVLASVRDRSGDSEGAFEGYRTVVALEPGNLVALNNLAYALATAKGRPAEARPLAERAYALSQGNPVMADTLAWVVYLQGDLPLAARLMHEAVTGAPAHPEIRFHAAVIARERGELTDARRHLARALQLEPGLSSREDVKRLEALLSPTR